MTSSFPPPVYEISESSWIVSCRWERHIIKVAGICYFHLRRLRTVRRNLGEKTTTSLVTAFVTSRLDYCNSVLAGLPNFNGGHSNSALPLNCFLCCTSSTLDTALNFYDNLLCSLPITPLDLNTAVTSRLRRRVYLLAILVTHSTTIFVWSKLWLHFVWEWVIISLCTSTYTLNSFFHGFEVQSPIISLHKTHFIY